MTSAAALRAVGVTSAALILIGIALLGELLGAFGDPDYVFIDYYGDSSNRARGLIGGSALLVGALAFVAFGNLLLNRLDPDRESAIAGYAERLSLLLATFVITAAAALVTVDFSRGFADLFDETETPFEGSTVVVLPQFGYVLLLVAGGWTAAAFVALTSFVGRSGGTLPGIVSLLGFIVAAVLLLSPMTMPFVLFPIWVLIVAFAARPEAETRA